MECCICKKPLTALTTCVIQTKEGNLKESCEECMIKNEGRGFVSWKEWNYNYKKYLESDRWKFLREWVLKENKYTCQRCGKHATQVHHLSYSNIYTDEEVLDLIAICKPCHKTEHNLVEA